jgi:hypothetical protein
LRFCRFILCEFQLSRGAVGLGLQVESYCGMQAHTSTSATVVAMDSIDTPQAPSSHMRCEATHSIWGRFADATSTHESENALDLGVQGSCLFSSFGYPVQRCIDR